MPVLVSKGRESQGGRRIVTTGLAPDDYQDAGIALRNAVASMIRYLADERGPSVLPSQILASVAASIDVSVVNDPPARRPCKPPAGAVEGR